MHARQLLLTALFTAIYLAVLEVIDHVQKAESVEFGQADNFRELLATVLATRSSSL